MNKKIKVLSLFSGIGAFEEAMSNLNIDFEVVNYCEFKDSIAKAYSLMHNIDVCKNLGDINTVDPNTIDDFDFMTYGFPCQDISALGLQKGLIDEDGNITRSGLFFKALDIAKAKKPKVMIAENVKALTFKKMKGDFDAMLNVIDDAGYNSYYKVLNSKDFGVPQSRSRVFIVSIRKDIDDHNFTFPEKNKLEISAMDLIDDLSNCSNSEYLYLEDKHSMYYNDFRLKKQYSSLNPDIAICMTTKQGHLTSSQNFIKDCRGVRMFSPQEMMVLQGFKKTHGNNLIKDGFSPRDIGFMVGNSITVNVLEKIIPQFIKYFNK